MKKKRERKVQTLIMLTESEIRYLDRKIKKNGPDTASRSSIIRFLVRHSMEKGLL
jgi:hypothetical protein